MKQKKVSVPEEIGKSFLEELTEKVTNPHKKADKLDLYTWTMRYRRFDGDPPSIPPPIIDIYKDTHHDITIMKAAQVFISEYGISHVLWGCDVGWADRGVCLYVFPKQEQMDDFSQDRVQRAINNSTYLRERVGSVDRGDNANRTRLRKVGGRPIYFRGSDSVMQTRSIDADIVICDEVDLFKRTDQEDAITRVRERMGSSLAPLFRAFSQPLYPGGPVDILYTESDQRHYYLRCQACGTAQHLEWDTNIEFSLDRTDVRTVCNHCKKPLDRLGIGQWVPHNSASDTHGYHISKLYSPRANLRQMLKDSLSTDPAVMQSFWNADLGVPYRPEGTPGLEEFVRDEYQWNVPLAECFMGVDVGRQLHVSILGRDHWEQTWKLMHRSTAAEFDDLDKIKKMYHPSLTIIDGQGDPRATKEWAAQYPGQVQLWFHKPSAMEPKRPSGSNEVHYHRTALLDLLYSTLKSHDVILHKHAGDEFYMHLESNVREIRKDDRDGRMYPVYVPTRADHYAFALAYAILATGMRPSNISIGGVNKGYDPEEAWETAALKQELGYDPDEDKPFGGFVTGSGRWSRWRAGV